MNFELADEHRLFGEQLRRALSAAAPLAETRACIDDNRSSPAAWKVLVEVGACAASIPEKYGGLGLGAFPLCVAAGEIGWAVASAPAPASLYLFSQTLTLAEDSVECAAWLPGIADGSYIGTAAMSSLQPTRFAGGRLTGVASPVPDGMHARCGLILAEADHEPLLVLVDLSSDGVARTALSCVDPGRPLARLEFAGVPAVPVGTARTAKAGLDRAAVCLAFEQVGGAERALEAARLYALERTTFGRRIGSYQAVKHKLANMWVKIEIARAHALYAGWALDSASPDLALAAAAARVAATEAYLFAAQEALQIHGGYGFTFESDCHLFYRRARSLAAVIGSSRRWGDQLSALIAAGATAVH